MPPSCQVCTAQPGTYKCSTCRAPYCSVTCYQQHKASAGCVPAAEQLPAAAAANLAKPAGAGSDAERRVGELLSQNPALQARLREVYETIKEPSHADETAPSGRDSDRAAEQRTKSALALIRQLREDGAVDTDSFDALIAAAKTLPSASSR